VDGTGRAITTAYEKDGRSVLVTDGLGHTTRTEYDALGRVFREVNALGQEIVYTYEDAMRRVMKTTPEGRKVMTANTRHGETESITDGRGNVTRFEFNWDGQRTIVKDALDRVISRSIYENSGRLYETIDARGTLTRFGYDHRNRGNEQHIDPSGLDLTTLIDFNALGRQIRVTEGAGSPSSRVTTYHYDRKGRTTTVVVDPDGLNLCMNQRYDGLDNRIFVSQGTVANPDQHVKLCVYDNLGRRAKEIIRALRCWRSADAEDRC
jgi:YD repeat-containing protein